MGAFADFADLVHGPERVGMSLWLLIRTWRRDSRDDRQESKRDGSVPEFIPGLVTDMKKITDGARQVDSEIIMMGFRQP